MLPAKIESMLIKLKQWLSLGDHVMCDLVFLVLSHVLKYSLLGIYCPFKKGKRALKMK